MPSVSSVVQSYTNNDWLNGDTVDNNGNTVTSPIAHLADHTGTYTDTYDFRNKLIRRVYTGGKVVDLSYDADGNRVSKIVLDGLTNYSEHHYLVDMNNHTGYAQVVEEKDSSGNLLRTNFYGHDLVKTNFVTEGYERYYQYDGLGSVRALSDGNGDITDEYTYDAFGILIDSTGDTPNQYLYTGEQWDSDLGMYFLRARYLNVSTGRFSNMDTYEGRNGEPLTLHKYLYVHANPISGIDPSGNLFKSTQGLGFQVEAAIEQEYRLDFNFPGIAPDVSFGGRTGFVSPRITVPVGNTERVVTPGLLKPDILNHRDQLWNEIKPLSVSGIAAAIVSWNIYNTTFTPFGYNPDPNWAPRSGGKRWGSVMVGGKEMFIANVAGILFYIDIRINFAELTAGAAVLNRKALVSALRSGYGVSRVAFGPTLRYAAFVASRSMSFTIQGLNTQRSISAGLRF